MFFICTQLGILDKNKTYELADVDDTELYYNVGKTNVSVELGDGLTYSGFDYKVEDKIKGHYFFLPKDSIMYLFILDEDTAYLVNRGKSAGIRATLVEDSAAAKYIESELSEQMDIGEDSLSGYVKEIIISQPDYPYFRIKLIGYVRKLSVYLIAITLLYFILAALIPELNMLFKLGNLAKSRKELISIMDKELSDNLEDVNRSVYTTRDYIIHAYISYINIEKRPV